MLSAHRFDQFQLFWLIVWLCLLPTPLRAQITPDGTTSTTVDVNGNNFTINDGELAGGNLFHSFGEFSVPTGSSAFFNNAADVENIINRVTGGNISNIDGLIRANGSANLFLLNPAGIIFGSNARLNIGGSFFGSTADSLLFDDGTEFSATETQTPILTINAPIGLNLRDNPQPITNRSVADGVGLQVSPGETITLVGGNVDLDGGSIFAPGGRVELGGLSAAGEIGINTDGSLSFPDGIERADVTLTNAANVIVRAAGDGSISVNGRNIELSGGELGGSNLFAGIATESGSTAAQAGDITLNATDNITVSQGSGIFNRVEASRVGNAGNIVLKADRINTESGSLIDSSNLGDGNSGDILLQANSINLIAPFITSQIAGKGQAGNIDIIAEDSILLRGERTLGGERTLAPTVTVATFGSSQGGNINLRGRSVSLETGIVLNAISQGEGNGGNIEIDANQVKLENALVNTSAFATGSGGRVRIDAAESVEIIGFGFSRLQESVLAPALQDPNAIDNLNIDDINTSLFQGILAATAGQGEAGGIEINTPRLSILDGSLIGAASIGEGPAGAIIINASELLEINEAIISTSTIDIADAGSIEINTGQLSISNGGVVVASTLSNGDGGDIKINATKLVELKGVFDSNNPSSLVVGSQRVETSGDAGDLQIFTPQLIVRDGAVITANTLGQGDGGNIEIDASDTVNVINNGTITVSGEGQGNAGELNIQADSLTLENGSSLAALTSAGDGGNITLEIADDLILRDSSTISAQAFNNANGGNIDIDADFVIAFPNQNNDILANAAEGRGGNINITTEGIFGIEERPLNLFTNDINASSEFGLEGSVAIDTPEVDATQGTTELPDRVVSPETFTAQACNPDQTAEDILADRESSFTVKGRGGLPSMPTDPLTSDAILVEGEFVTQSEKGEITEAEEEDKFVTIVEQTEPVNIDEIVPARGMIVKENGVVILTGYPTANSSPRTPTGSTNCN